MPREREHPAYAVGDVRRCCKPYFPGSPVLASLSLAQSAYYSKWYTLCVVIGWSTAIAYKVLQMSGYSLVFTIVNPILFAVWTVLATFRLRLAHTGNHKERVPELSAFILLSVFPYLPLTITLAVGIGPSLPIEPLLMIPLIPVGIADVVWAVRTLQRLVTAQKAMFYRLVQEGAVTADAAGPPTRASTQVTFAQVVQDGMRHLRGRAGVSS